MKTAAKVLPFPQRAEKMQRVLFIPDVHVPYHDRRAFRLLLKIAKAEKFDTVVILGDFCDFYQVSFHAKSPDRVLRFKDELRQAAKLLRELEACGFKRKIYVHGNHEHRLTRYLCDKAPELYELVVKQDLLGLAANGWEEVAYKDDIRIGRLYVTHDVGRAGIFQEKSRIVGRAGVERFLHRRHEDKGRSAFAGVVVGDPGHRQGHAAEGTGQG